MSGASDTTAARRGRLPEGWTLPAVDDTNRAWFTSGTLAVQRCTSCSTLQHPPEEICHQCGSMTFDHQRLAPQGTVHSHTLVHYAVNAALAPAVPYAVVLVTVDEAPHVRVIGNLVDADPSSVRIGLPVEAVWDEYATPDGDTVKLVQWRPR